MAWSDCGGLDRCLQGAIEVPKMCLRGALEVPHRHLQGLRHQLGLITSFEKSLTLPGSQGPIVAGIHKAYKEA